MVKSLENRILNLLSKRYKANHDELAIFLMLNAAAAFSGLNHLGFLFLFAVLGLPQLMWANTLSVSIYATCLLLVNRGRYAACGLLLSLEVLIYTVVSLYLLGPHSYVLMFPMVTFLMQLVIPYTGGKARGAILFLCWAEIVYVILAGDSITPLIEVSSATQTLLAILNLHITLIGIAAQLVVRTFINNLVSAYKSIQLEEMTSQANTDSLTGLFNRRYADLFFERLRTGPVDGNHLAMLDIDDFKSINDRFGHQKGDEILMLLSDCMRGTLRKTDVIFRWGGEEFLIVLENTSAANAVKVLEKLRKRISELSIPTEHDPISFTVTIGVAPLNLHDVEGSIFSCDQKMYQGKLSGKNTVII